MPLEPSSSNIDAEIPATKNSTVKKKAFVITKDSSTHNNPAPTSIYVITEGAAKRIWMLDTFINKQDAILIPVFDNTEIVTELLTHLGKDSYAGREVLLSTLAGINEGQSLRFALNPGVVVYNGVFFLQEGTHWALNFEQLTEVVMEKAKH
jgi:hypothetical protein